MAKKMTQAEIRAKARETVLFFNAVMRIDEDAKVRRGTYKHLDPDVEDDKGWWVECHVFVQEENQDSKE